MGVPYGTDAGPLGEAGLPCFVFGPGDIAQAHTKDEWVELDQVRLASEMYFEIARELGRSAGPEPVGVRNDGARQHRRARGCSSRVGPSLGRQKTSRK